MLFTETICFAMVPICLTRYQLNGMLFINTLEGVKQVVFYLMEMLILHFIQTSKQCHVVDILMSISIDLVAHNLEMCALPDAFSCYMAEIYAPRGAIPGVWGVGCLRVPPPLSCRRRDSQLGSNSHWPLPSATANSSAREARSD